MEISAFTIYWVTVIGSFCDLLNFMAMFCAISAFTIGVCCATEYRTQMLLPWLRLVVAVGLVSMVLACFVPSKADLAAMYILPPLANSAQIHQLPSEMGSLVLDWMKNIQKNH